MGWGPSSTGGYMATWAAQGCEMPHFKFGRFFTDLDERSSLGTRGTPG